MVLLPMVAACRLGFLVLGRPALTGTGEDLAVLSDAANVQILVDPSAACTLLAAF